MDFVLQVRCRDLNNSCINLGILWTFFGNSLGILWEFFGNFLEILWEFFGNSLGILWEFLGNFELQMLTHSCECDMN